MAWGISLGILGMLIGSLLAAWLGFTVPYDIILVLGILAVALMVIGALRVRALLWLGLGLFLLTLGLAAATLVAGV